MATSTWDSEKHWFLLKMSHQMEVQGQFWNLLILRILKHSQHNEIHFIINNEKIYFTSSFHEAFLSDDQNRYVCQLSLYFFWIIFHFNYKVKAFTTVSSKFELRMLTIQRFSDKNNYCSHCLIPKLLNVKLIQV